MVLAQEPGYCSQLNGVNFRQITREISMGTRGKDFNQPEIQEDVASFHGTQVDVAGSQGTQSDVAGSQGTQDDVAGSQGDVACSQGT